MSPGQSLAYISDVGAQELKPLFVTGCVLTTVLLDTSFILDRWLRHRGRLVPEYSRAEKALNYTTIAFAIIGTIGLSFLSGFDTMRYPRLHLIFLLLFIVGYLVSALLICIEYQRLGKRRQPTSPSPESSADVFCRLSRPASFAHLFLDEARLFYRGVLLGSGIHRH